MNTKIAVGIGMLVFLGLLAIGILIINRIQELHIKKIILYPELGRKYANSLIISGVKIKNKDLTPWYSEKLSVMEERLKELKCSYESTSGSEEKNAYKEVLQQCSEEMVKWCTQLKNEYRYILRRKDIKHLNTQINFANSIL